MTKSPRKNVPDVGIEVGAACMPSELASDRVTAPGPCKMVVVTKVLKVLVILIIIGATSRENMSSEFVTI